jgi:molybdopterin synthase catalytic subunit
MFIGTVRNHHEGKAVEGISYDVHPALAGKTLRDICEEAGGLWAGTKYYAVHYHGSLGIGGISIVIAVGAAHREEAFEACRYVIEEIKKRAPVWKKEHYADGESAWLPGCSLIGEAPAQAVCCGKCDATR